MQLSCIHCGKPFRISQEQLGGTGRCPHCGGQIQLPKAGAESPTAEEASPSGVRAWWDNSVSAVVSVIIHLLLMLILAFVSYNSYSGEGIGEEVLIGELPSETLTDAADEELSSEEATTDNADEELEEMEIEPIVVTTEDSTLAELAEPSALSGGESSRGFDVGTITMGGGSMAGGSWDGLMQTLRRNGLDIVITFDSTGSMGGEINVVKSQISRIGKSLIKLVPKARISLCTYRDQGESYLVRGIPLTNNIQELDQFLAGVSADGGGDDPEAVQEGLRWAVTENQFNRSARKVVLLFGDAPPHRVDLPECLRIASGFHRQQEGVVSTVTCRRPARMMEFEQIANVGGGEAYLTSDERQIMTELMTLVFGGEYRAKVVEALELME